MIFRWIRFDVKQLVVFSPWIFRIRIRLSLIINVIIKSRSDRNNYTFYDFLVGRSNTEVRARITMYELIMYVLLVIRRTFGHTHPECESLGTILTARSFFLFMVDSIVFGTRAQNVCHWRVTWTKSDKFREIRFWDSRIRKTLSWPKTKCLLVLNKNLAALVTSTTCV